MNEIQQQAIDAFKAAFGWKAEPSERGATVQLQSGMKPTLNVQKDGSWACHFGHITGAGVTPAEAIAEALPQYQRHVALMAAEVLPGEKLTTAAALATIERQCPTPHDSPEAGKFMRALRILRKACGGAS